MATLMDEFDRFMSTIMKEVTVLAETKIKDIVLNNVEISAQKNVYDIHSRRKEPYEYWPGRRYSLLDDNQYSHKVDVGEKFVKLTVENTTCGNPETGIDPYDEGPIGEMIESGGDLKIRGGVWNWKRTDLGTVGMPRPWMEEGGEMSVRETEMLLERSLNDIVL